MEDKKVNFKYMDKTIRAGDLKISFENFIRRYEDGNETFNDNFGNKIRLTIELPENIIFTEEFLNALTEDIKDLGKWRRYKELKKELKEK